LKNNLPSHAIAAEDRPALEDFLISGFPSGIVGPERQPWINHHGEVSVVLETDGDAGKVGVCADPSRVCGSPGFASAVRDGVFKGSEYPWGSAWYVEGVRA